MGYLSTISSTLYTVGTYGLKIGLVAMPASRAFIASGLHRIQVIGPTAAIDPQTQSRINNTAKSMGIVPHVSCFNMGKALPSSAMACGANFSWSHPTLLCNSTKPSFGNCAHELVHIKKNHSLIAETLSTAAMLGTAICSPSLTMTGVAMAVTYLGTNLLYRQFEKEADLGGCVYNTAEEISESVRKLGADVWMLKVERELLPTRPFFSRCLGYLRATSSGNYLLPLDLTMGLIDDHPPLTTRIQYLKEEYYKKPLQAVSITVSNDARPIRMHPKVSAIVREMIKASKKEDCLIGASHIVLHPNQSEDNLEFCFSKDRSVTYNVSTENVQKFLHARVKERLPILQQLLNEALKSTDYMSLTFPIQEDTLSEQTLNSIKDGLKKLPSYDASKMRYKQIGHTVKIIIPKKTS